MKETMLEQVKDSYIKAELGQILRLHTLKRDTILSIDKSLDHFLGRLPHWQKDALLFLLSRIYRRNGIYRLSGNKNWSLVNANIEEVYLTRINEPVNRVLSISEINWNLHYFVRYLNCYFGSNPVSDPENLAEFKEIQEVYYSTLIGVKYESNIMIIDGAHRAVSLCRAGHKALDLFVTVRI